MADKVQLARQELAKRELERRGVSVDEIEPKESMSTMGVGGYIKKHPYKTIFQSPVETISGKSAQDRLLDQYWKGLPAEQSNVVTRAIHSLGGFPVSAAGLAVDTLSPATLATMGASALKPVQKVVGMIAETKPAQEFGKFLTRERDIFPKTISRGIEKYKTLRKGSQFEGIRTDLTTEQRVENLKKVAQEKYGVPIKQEEEILKKKIGLIEEKQVGEISAIKDSIKQNKEKLKNDIDVLSEKMNKNMIQQEKSIDTISEVSSKEGKRRVPQFSRENSTAYGNKLDNIVEIAEKEGKLPTKKALQEIFDKTDAEIAETFIDRGIPLSKYEALKDKYITGLSEAINPELKAIEKTLGFKKGEMKNAGIDWSRVNISHSGRKIPNPNAPVNLKELLKDVRSVTKSISAKGKGVEKAFDDEDLAAIIFQKNIGEYMSSSYPEFGKLQKAYSPIMETMKNARKLFKPGETGTLGNIPGTLKKPDLLEKDLIRELESGYEGFSKGTGQITRPIKKAQSKLEGTKRSYEIAKKSIEKLSLEEQIELEKLLQMKEESYQLLKKQITKEGISKQESLRNDLEKRLFDLEKGRYRGKEKISKLVERSKVTGKERRALEGGGLFTEISYLIRRIIARGLLR